MTIRTVLAAGLVVAGFALPALAEDSAISLPGGMRDTSIDGKDVYIGEPKPANPGHSKACRQAKKYIDTVNAGAADTPNLFADDAVTSPPIPKHFVGGAAIADFYHNTVGPLHGVIMGVGYTGEGDHCMLEIAGRLDVNGQQRWVLVAVDNFTINSAGKFSRMIAYSRPQKSGSAEALLTSGEKH